MGKFKEIVIDLLLGSILMAVGFELRYFVYLYYKYPMDIDTYYFLRVIRDHIPGWRFMFTLSYFFNTSNVWILFAAISIITIWFFYSLCRLYTKRLPSFIATLFFALSPLLFLNNKFNMIDKNAPSILMIILIIANIRILKDWWSYIFLLFNFALFAWIWEGWVGMVVICLIYLIVYLFVNKWKPIYLIALVLGLIGIFIYYFGRIMTLANARDRILISELNPIWNLGIFAEYLIMILVFIFVFTKIRLEKKDKKLLNEYLFLYVGFIATFFATCLIFRINIFFLPFLYLWFAIMIGELEYSNWIKILIIIFIALFVFGTSWRMYMQSPLMNDGIKESMDYINTLPSPCLINVWSMGSIYQYYTGKTVLYSSSAQEYDEQIGYMVNGKQTDCSIIYTEEDIKALEYMIKYKVNLNITREKYYIVNTVPDKVILYDKIKYNIINQGGLK